MKGFHHDEPFFRCWWSRIPERICFARSFQKRSGFSGNALILLHQMLLHSFKHHKQVLVKVIGQLPDFHLPNGLRKAGVGCRLVR